MPFTLVIKLAESSRNHVGGREQVAGCGWAQIVWSNVPSVRHSGPLFMILSQP